MIERKGQKFGSILVDETEQKAGAKSKAPARAETQTATEPDKAPEKKAEPTAPAKKG